MALWSTLLTAALVIGCGDKDGSDDGSTDTGSGGDTSSDSGSSGDAGTDSGSTDGGNPWADTDGDDDGYPEANDCNDSDPNINPGADELCNGFDDNCDGVVDDDAIDKLTVYPDRDSDGYGNPLAGVDLCPDEIEGGSDTGASPYADYVDNDLDCRDSDATINPDGREVCDEANLDEDCDGLREDEDPDADPSTMTTFQQDADGDGYGDASATVQGCDAGDIRSVNSIDCDDSDASIGPDSTCAPWDGVWTGAVQLEVEGPYGYSGECDDSGSLTISDGSTTQVTGSVTCNWYAPYGYSYYPLNMSFTGSLNYPWGVEGTWSDSSGYYSGGTTSFDGEFSADGQSLILYIEGTRDDWSGSYDLFVAGDWTLEP